MEPPANSMPDPADRSETADPRASTPVVEAPGDACLLYTSDAADD